MMQGRLFKKVGVLTVGLLLASCASNISHVQKESPANAYKDYREENAKNAAVIGIGEPMSKQKMRVNATIKLTGMYDLNTIMSQMSGTYNVAVRWGGGVRKNARKNVLISDLTFDESRSYIEDVYDVQIIREGERRLLVLPSITEERIANFNPGVGVSLSEVLRGLAKQCGTNLVITENDKKLNESLVTARLQDITCHDAFEALLAPQGMSLIDKGDFYMISGLPQRQWTLDLYEPEREEEVEVSYQSEFEGSSGNEDGGGTQTAGGTTKVTLKKSRNLWQELENDLNSLLMSSCQQMTNVAGGMNGSSNGGGLLPPPTMQGSTGMSSNSSLSANANTGMNNMGAGGMNSTGAGGMMGMNALNMARCGYVRVNKSVGLIQMQATHSVLEEANDWIQRVEEIASRRLLLEARVLAVTRTRNFDQRSNLAQATSAGESTILNTGFTGTLNSIASVLTGRLASTPDVTGGFFGIKNNSLDAVVGLVEQYGTTYQLMQPMMELMDRQRATMIDGTNRVYYLREIQTETIDNVTTRTTTADTFNQFAGLQFSATAQVAEGNEPHTISLQIPITEITSEESIPQVVDGETLNDKVPVVTTRLIDQKVRIRDGEVKVIGGLTKTIAIDKETGMPLMRDLPVFGTLFNEENISFEEVEFVILLQVRRLY